ncbi:TPA: aspartyl-tRNA amidotransferase [Candidatus Uhrbacteria bacterium]|uniref:GatB/Yqey family protein n=1 Tax=Candidatus Uhrbacteria bacterium GW2011_GWC2_53_7 TaxID=1618986 RepID=A0A0G2ASB2_9BACT|nr:MAG: GatB/Yqey family protein [Parcubacteria group bacterium GW2011_GWA2_53_21]KKW35674.1 MAG: GatB/Yqey family protein [Candidatus Uhrbacteria bacterium GW2011_GWC2_53_7]OGL71418.1 MAG: hypothetical protein A3D69_03395 [Candidatus Uhrbacteria bacterium RIFCSPHIGHO2_02_FULL_54_11]HBL39090.1 aspartyl-tRNA amidotransferase [Candidatus Uhrbacteria bacterium]
MPLPEQIMNDVKVAMKAKEAQTLSTLRLLQSSLKNKKIELGKELEEGDVISVVKKEVKALEDSIVSFVQGAREDLAQKARAEVETLKNYLPEEMSDERLETIVKEALAEIGAVTKAEMGKVMGAVMGKVAGSADGKRVKAIVEKLLK